MVAAVQVAWAVEREVGAQATGLGVVESAEVPAAELKAAQTAEVVLEAVMEVVETVAVREVAAPGVVREEAFLEETRE